MAKVQALVFFFFAVISLVTSAETGFNGTTSFANSETTASSGMASTTTEGVGDTSTTKAEDTTTTTTQVPSITTTAAGSMSTSDGQPILIGNSQPPTVLQVDTSSQTSTAPSEQTKMFDSSSAAPTTWTSSSSSSEPSTMSETTTIQLNTSWVPGKFPPPGLESGTEEAKDTTPKTTGVKWEVNATSSSEDPNKHKYDVMVGDQPATTDNMKKPSGPKDEPPTIGSSKEVETENKPMTSSSQNGHDHNGVARRSKDSFHIIAAASLLLFAYARV